MLWKGEPISHNIFNFIPEVEHLKLSFLRAAFHGDDTCMICLVDEGRPKIYTIGIKTELGEVERDVPMISGWVKIQLPDSICYDDQRKISYLLKHQRYDNLTGTILTNAKILWVS